MYRAIVSKIVSALNGFLIKSSQPAFMTFFLSSSFFQRSFLLALLPSGYIISSTRVFHSLQELHFPSHFALLCPQDVQTKIFLGLANFYLLISLKDIQKRVNKSNHLFWLSKIFLFLKKNIVMSNIANRITAPN